MDKKVSLILFPQFWRPLGPQIGGCSGLDIISCGETSVRLTAAGSSLEHPGCSAYDWIARWYSASKSPKDCILAKGLSQFVQFTL